LSKELLSKQTAGVLRAVMNQPHWQKDELQKGFSKILLQLKQSVGSPEGYLESLLRNVTFLYENTNRASAFLQQCIEEEKFASQESFHKLMVDVPRQVKESNFLAENMPRFKDFVYKGSTIEEQVGHAEMVYFNSKLVNDLMIDFIGTFLHPDNKEQMGSFMQYASNVVVEAVSHYCTTFAGLIIEEISSPKVSK
jgi:hypothetical protein